MSARRKVAAPARPALVIYDDIEQGTTPWFEVKLGVPSASNFAAIMAGSEERRGRAKLLDQLAGEILTGQTRKTFQNEYMNSGIEREPEALAWYSRTRFVELQKVGFVYNPEYHAGWSPDALVGDEGAVEVKCVEPHVLIEIRRRGRFPAEHRAQCQGGALWVGRRRWVDLVVYSHERMPKLTFRLEPDPVYHDKEIAPAIATFNYELKNLVDDLRRANGEIVPLRRDADAEIPR